MAPRLTAGWAAHHQLTTIDATPDIADKQRKIVNTILTSMLIGCGSAEQSGHGQLQLGRPAS